MYKSKCFKFHQNRKNQANPKRIYENTFRTEKDGGSGLQKNIKRRSLKNQVVINTIKKKIKFYRPYFRKMTVY